MDANRPQTPDTQARQSLVFFTKWEEIISLLPGDAVKAILHAICRYAAAGELPELSGAELVAFEFIRRDIDFNTEKYDRVSQARREAGRRGGKAKAKAKAIRNDESAVSDCDPAAEAPAAPTAAASCDIEAIVADAAEAESIDECPTAETASALPSWLKAEARPEEPHLLIAGRRIAPDEFVRLLESSDFGRESFCANNDVTAEHYGRLLRAVVSEWVLTGHEHATFTDARRHAVNHMRKKLEAERRDAAAASGRTAPKRREEEEDIYSCFKPKVIYTEEERRRKAAEYYQECIDRGLIPPKRKEHTAMAV